MKIILLSENHHESRTMPVNRAMAASALLVVSSVLILMIFLGYQLASGIAGQREFKALSNWQVSLKSQRQDIANLQQKTINKLEAYAVRIAQLQARLVRIEALGERLSDVTSLDNGEFDFSRAPGLGGPDEMLADTAEPAIFQSNALFLDDMNRMEQLIKDREQQLGILQSLMANRQIDDDGYLAGRPINKGWMSSAYGKRNDPFHGRQAWHKGVDFAGKEDSNIVAVASGVVTWAGDRYGYGKMVEINHANGYATRYAHNKTNLIAVGDVVKRGAVIARMGSSGRSTGPHVHFEVLHHGKAVDPNRYINRRQR